jgi:hypothetical protein
MSAEAPARHHERNPYLKGAEAGAGTLRSAHTGALTDGHAMLVAVTKEVFGVGL